MKLNSFVRTCLLGVFVGVLILYQTSFMGNSVIASSVTDVDIETDKQVYDVGDAVQIRGNVTADGTPVSDALVGVEVISPYDNSFVIRTVQTGEIPSGYWKIEILDLYTCNSSGYPKTLFAKGSWAYIYLRIKNNDFLTHHIEPSIYIQCSDNSALTAFYAFGLDLEALQEVNYTVSFQIPSSATSGQALIFASVFDTNLTMGGTPYCPELISSFYIAFTTPLAPTPPQYFNIDFKLPKKDMKLGNYSVIARSFYGGHLGTDQKSIKIVLLGDLVKDGKIDMRDIGALCNLYSLEEGDPDWNPEADLIPDGIINMRDVGRICNNFGETAIY